MKMAHGRGRGLRYGNEGSYFGGVAGGFPGALREMAMVGVECAPDGVGEDGSWQSGHSLNFDSLLSICARDKTTQSFGCFASVHAAQNKLNSRMLQEMGTGCTGRIPTSA